MFLPPTSISVGENVKRSHLQACVWKQATELDPLELNPVDYGWEKNDASKSFNPVMLPKISKVLQLIKCSNGSESPCGTQGVVVTGSNFFTSFVHVTGMSPLFLKLHFT